MKKNFNSHEVKFLSLFMCTTRCRCIVWDDFFGNHAKCKCNTINSLLDYLLTVFVVQLTYPETTICQPLPGMRCCNNCEPRLFEVEQITLNKAPAFKRGKKWKTSTAFEDAVQNNLTQWHDNELLDHFYGYLHYCWLDVAWQ